MSRVGVRHRALAVGVCVVALCLAGAPASAAWRGGGWHGGGVWRGGGGWHGGGVWRGGGWHGGGVWRGGAWGYRPWGGGVAWGRQWGPGWGSRPWGYRPWGVWGNPWIGVASVPVFVPPYPSYDVYEDEPGVCVLRRAWVRGPFGWHRVRRRVCW